MFWYARYSRALKSTMLLAGIIVLAGTWMPQPGWAAPSVTDALKYQPVQAGIHPDNPAPKDVERCTIKLSKINGSVAWVVRGPTGNVLRQFADSDGDNNVDTWSYFRDGLEIYRDIDADFNGKADQYRWFHWAGSRWGINTDEDPKNTIDNWKLISPEETAEQVVLALRAGNAPLFESLVLTPEEISKLGLAKAQAKQLTQRATEAKVAFKKLVDAGDIDKTTEFSDFGGLKPSMIPAGTHGSSKDIMVYENAWAMIKKGEDHQQLQLGTMVSVKGAWKLIDGPTLGGGQLGISVYVSGLGGAAGREAVVSPGEQPAERVQELLAELEKLDQKLASSPQQQKPSLNEARAKLLQAIAEVMPNQAEREQWFRQLADMVSAATQDGTYPAGVEVLGRMEKKLAADGESPEIVAYFEFHRLLAEYYGVTLADEDVDYAEAQAKFQKDLEAYVERHPRSDHGAEALRMLAVGSEMSGDVDEAVIRFRQILEEYPESSAAAVAKGAVTRLTSKGREIQLQGTDVGGGKIDLRDYRKKVVVIQYWTAGSPICKADHSVLSDLYKKYGGSRGLEIISVNLDFDRNQFLAYLKANRLPWKQLFEPGGFDSRLAREMGVVTVPLMLLVGVDGVVISNNIQAAEIETELKKLLPTN
ncbi:MAG: redoxin domain-containing protein [Pirellulales bacterium]|nr:redoxin domain-containing protein [Pirellulales bacterium]